METPVIASVSDAIHGLERNSFVADASRNDGECGHERGDWGGAEGGRECDGNGGSGGSGGGGLRHAPAVRPAIIQYTIPPTIPAPVMISR